MFSFNMQLVNKGQDRLTILTVRTVNNVHLATAYKIFVEVILDNP